MLRYVTGSFLLALWLMASVVCAEVPAKFEADITGKVIKNEGRSFVVEVQSTTPAEGLQELVGKEIKVLARWGANGPNEAQLEMIKTFKVGSVVSFNASSSKGLENIRLNGPPKHQHDDAPKEDTKEDSKDESKTEQDPQQ